MEHHKSTAQRPNTSNTVPHDTDNRRGKRQNTARPTTKISRTSRTRRTTYIGREVTTISRATQTLHTSNSPSGINSTASQTTSPLNSPIDIATKTGTSTKVFSMTTATIGSEQEQEQDIQSDRREDLTNQLNVTTQTTYTSSLLGRPSVLIMASRQQQDRRPADVLFLVKSAIRYPASIITSNQYREIQIVQPMLINIKHHFDQLDESTHNRKDVLEIIDFLTNKDFHHYQNKQMIGMIVNRIMLDRPEYEHGCALQHLLDLLDLIQQKMTPDEMEKIIRQNSYVSLPQVSYLYERKRMQTKHFDDETTSVTEDRVNDILHRIRRVISPSPFTQM